MRQSVKMPESIEAEQQLLGAMFLSRNAWEEVAASIKPEHFYRVAHQHLYAALCEIHEANVPAEPVMVFRLLEQTKRLQKIGETPEEASEYIATIADCCPSWHGVAEHYGKIIKERWLGRTLVESFMDYNKRILDGGDTRAVLSEAYLRLHDLTKEDTRELYRHIKEPLTEAWEFVEERERDKRDITGIPSGIHSLDHITMGFQSGDYVIIAARPGNGKTALMLQTVYRAASLGMPVGVFSLEMSAVSLSMRLLSHSSKIGGKAMRSGRVGEHEWKTLVDAYTQIYDYPIYVCDKSGLHVREIPIIARRMVVEQDVKAVFVDYIGLVTSDAAGSREQEVSRMSKALQQMSRDLKIPVIVLCQLNRGMEYRKEEPKLFDLRESGSLEQDADVVILIHNPKSDDDPYGIKGRDAKLLVEKQRNLPPGFTEVRWDGNKQAFFDVEKEREPSDYYRGGD